MSEFREGIAVWFDTPVGWVRGISGIVDVAWSLRDLEEALLALGEE